MTRSSFCSAFFSLGIPGSKCLFTLKTPPRLMREKEVELAGCFQGGGTKKRRGGVGRGGKGGEEEEGREGR